MKPLSLQQLFPPELRTASVVPRWSVVWTLNKDTVANHSFYVVFYSRQIARMIGWSGTPHLMADLMFFALIHDLDETITGDIVSPVKAEIVDRQRADEYIYDKMKERLPVVVDEWTKIQDRSRPEATEAIQKIVKAADRLDALLFLVTERRMGNAVVAPRIPLAWANLEKAWFDLPADGQKLKDLYENIISNVVIEHTNVGGTGV